MTTPLDLSPGSVTDSEFGVPDHTRSATLTDRVKEGVTGRSRLSTRPPKSREEKPRKTRTVEPPSREGEFTDALEDAYTLVGGVLFPFDPHCAGVLLQVEENPASPHVGKTRARICAEALDKAATKNDSLRRILRMLTTGGVWGAVIMAHAPILMAVISHHTPLMNNFAQWQAERMQKLIDETEKAQS